MTPLYIIPARGGSKGIPRKNIKPLCGRPLLAYTAEVALAHAKITGGTVVLSTDDDEIAAVGSQYGLATDYKRPAELGGDKVGSREVMLDVMNWADAQGIRYDAVILLQPTSPLRTVEDIAGSCALYADGVDMVTTVCAASDNPYYNMFEIGADGYIRVCKGDGLYTRRQDCPPVYVQNGAVYVFRPESLRTMPLGAMPHRMACVMPADRSVDLDTPEDWCRLESKMLADEK